MIEERSVPPSDRAIQDLVHAIKSWDLDVVIHERDGKPCVRIYPPGAPAAGAEIHVTDGSWECQFFTEWGSALTPATVLERVLWLFGKRRPKGGYRSTVPGHGDHNPRVPAHRAHGAGGHPSR